MAVEQVTATAKAGDQELEVTVDYDFGDNLQDAVERFGEDVVFNEFKANARVKLQSGMRGKAFVKDEDGNVSPADPKVLQEWADSYKPGTGRTRKSTEDKILELTSKMTDEEFQAFLAKISSK